ncbi:tetratricopeptide repeat protein [Ktedonobacter racemifer]|uniref:TPR repeat-containing protein n=1 Tax=Ktedonobacter racemifer DSM 44963 TaxID=485913 RepID=D6TJL0_KTERA|nr:tetratricopeptide repeat protein [Ktedonobacter racemifer]EFH89617.1 TPR repeat-containing protein [Ktedonobacter racemifer DSM 44963]
MSQKQKAGANANANSKRAHTSPGLSPEEQAWVQQQLTDYPGYTQALQAATHTRQAQEALSPLLAQSEPVQQALIQSLGKQITQEAADLLQALHELASTKEVRKEARRSLLRLENAKITPHWQLPAEEQAPTQPTTPQSSTPPRFWKGFYTDTLAEEEAAEVILLWEEGDGYKEALIMGMTLDYRLHGIEDFFYEAHLSKRQAEKRLEYIRTQQFSGARFLPCTLPEARHLMQDALDILEEHGARAPIDFVRYRQIVDELILSSPDAEIENEDEEIMPKENEPSPFDITQEMQNFFENFFAAGDLFDQTVEEFFDAWSEGNYGEAYDLLAHDSPLRQGLEREAWVQLREQWRAEAQPANFRILGLEERLEDEDEEDFLDEEDEDDELEDEEDEDELEDEDEDELDIEAEEGIIDVCWSLEMRQTPLSERLPELPRATAVYDVTGRHWFWSSFTVIDEGGEPRLVSHVDEGTQLQILSDEELETRSDELIQRYEQLMEKLGIDEEGNRIAREESEDKENEENEELVLAQTLAGLQKGITITNKYLHHLDAQIARHPDEKSEQYQQAASQAEASQDLERAAYYLQAIADRFPELAPKALISLANAQQRLAQAAEQDEERSTRFFKLAEQNLHTSLEKERSALGLILLAQQLSHEYAKFDEAEKLLHEAVQLSPNANEALMIAVNQGMIEEYRNHIPQAIEHYQRATTIAPDFPNLWNNIGYLQLNMEQYDEAEKSFLQSVDHDPTNTEAYVHLADLYVQVREDIDGAEDILQQGLEINEDDIGILGKLTEVYIQKGELKEAEQYLEAAEEISPDSAFVQELRANLDQARTEKRRAMKSRGDQRKANQSQNKAKKHKK